MKEGGRDGVSEGGRYTVKPPIKDTLKEYL